MERQAISYLGCAEPSWATAVSARQLRGMLTLSALLSETVYISDVHIGDNANFLQSYLADSRLGLHRHVRSLSEAGIVRFLLRRESIRPDAKVSSFPCDNFADVYRSWRAQDPDTAWIIPPQDDLRLRFLQSIDEWSSNALVRYDYGAVKRLYMATVRNFFDAGLLGRFAGDLIASIPNLETEYAAVLKRDWFSLSNMYDFFQSRGVAASHPVMLVHGLMNETCYNHALGSHLVGADLNNVPLEETFWPDMQESGVARPGIGAANTAEQLLAQASHIIKAPALSILGLLTGEEISFIRDSYSRGYFDLLHLMNDPSVLGNTEVLLKQFVRTTAKYWENICDYLAENHAEATRRPRRLALLAGATPRSVRRASHNTFSLAVNVGIPVASEASGLLGLGLQASRMIAEKLNLRLIFFAETEELAQLRSVIPGSAWMTKSAPALFPAQEGGG
ncbi:hypothetical protein ACQPYE_39925 [Actinosynnema sp. CA-299493]